MIKGLAASICLVFVGASVAFSANGAGGFDGLGSGSAQTSGFGISNARSALPIPPLPVGEAPKRMQVAQSAGNLVVRQDRAEAVIRQLQGEVERLSFENRTLKDQLRRFQEDVEFRLREIEQGKRSGKRRKSSNARPQQQPQQFQQLGKPPQNLGSLPQDQQFGGQSLSARQLGAQPFGTPNSGGSGPIDLSAMLGGGAVGGAAGGGAASTVALTGDPNTDYDQAYGFVLRGDYASSERAFRQFVQSYGQHPLSANANYWIGESLYQRGKFGDAIEVFLNAYSSYPNAQKAPDMLLKTGMSLRKLKEREAACATYEELLAKYPNASPAVRQKVRAEISSAKC